MTRGPAALNVKRGGACVSVGDRGSRGQTRLPFTRRLKYRGQVTTNRDARLVSLSHAARGTEAGP